MLNASVHPRKFGAGIGGIEIGRRAEFGTRNDDAVVAIFTVKFAAFPLVSATGFGVTAHVLCDGAPEHAMLTFPE